MSTLTKIQQEKAAAVFAAAWQGKGYEKGDTQKFWLELLQKVFGVENPYSFIEFEGQVMVDSTNPSIATAVLRTAPKGLLEDFNTFGLLFESLCTRDMRIYAQANDGEVYHFRDKNGLEADMIVALNDGRWAPIEVKLGNKQIEEAAIHLQKLARKVDDEKMGKPSFLMVLTGGEYAYCRKDGVLVVPIGCLKD